MGGSRRLRAKQEGTFLESLKGLLQELKQEIAQIRLTVQDVKSYNDELRIASWYTAYPFSSANDP